MSTEAIAKRHAAASPGPWTYRPDPVDDVRDSLGFPVAYADHSGEVYFNAGTGEFIAHSWSDVAELLAEVDRLRHLLCGGLHKHERRMRDGGYCSSCQTGEPDY